MYGGGETDGVAGVNDEKPLKGLRSVPKVLKIALLLIASSPLWWK